MLQEVQLTNFTAGELSPRMKGRTDYAKYYNGNAIQQNLVTMPQGGVTKRPGTLLVALARDQTGTPFRVRLPPFVFSTVQPYQLELGSGYARIMANRGAVINAQPVTGAANNGSGLVRLSLASTAGLYVGNLMTVAGVVGTTEANGLWTLIAVGSGTVDISASFVHAYVSGGTTSTPVEVPLPYQAADLAAVKYTQSADTFYLVHPNYPPASLGRLSNTDWVYTVLAFQDGPYQNQNPTRTTLSGTTSGAAAALTASAQTGINNDQGFLASDVGRPLRLYAIAQGTSLSPLGWNWFLIDTVVSPTQITATAQPAIPNGAISQLASTLAPTTQWQLGAWSATLGYPGAIMLWQQRLNFGAWSSQPNGIASSMLGNYTGFSPTEGDGTVTAINALSWVLADEEVNAVNWLSSAGSAQAQQLAIGTSSGEHILQGATTQQAISATNVQGYRETKYGGAPNVQPLYIGKALIFADLPGRKLREWSFYWQLNGYDGPDKTVVCEHLTRGRTGTPPTEWGIRRLAYQQNPYQVIWACRNDGGLVAFTYDRDQDVWAGAPQILGGQYYGGVPIVEDICVTPSADGTSDQLFLVVLRTIAGVPLRTIEVMSPYFDGMNPDQAVFVDCAVASALTFPNAILTPPSNLVSPPPAAGTLAQTMLPAWTGTGNFAASAAVFAGTSADVGQMIRINGGVAVITAPVSTEVVTAQVLRPLLSLAPAAAAAWSCSPLATSFQGLSYCNGEIVGVQGDGADLGRYTVATNGIGSLASAVSYAVAGFPYTPVLLTMPFEPQRAAQAAAGGKIKRLTRAYVRFHETGGADIGRRTTDPMTQKVTDTVEALKSRASGQTMGVAPPLYTGIAEIPLQGGFDREGQVLITHDTVLPLTVLGIFANAEVGEMPLAA
jgi:hypothetical protein